MALQFYVIPAALYAVVASPATYQATRGVFGSWVASSEGTARLGGLILHAIVFILLASFAMSLFPKKASYGRSMYGHMADVVGVLDTQPGDYDKGGETHRGMAPAPYL
jgi:hypothetical protein